MHRWITLMVASMAVACESSSAEAVSVNRRCTIFVDFKAGSSILASAALDELNRFVMECDDLYGGTVVIHGHSDSREALKGGAALSRARVEAVRDYLMSTGVLARSIQVEAHGDKLPTASPVGDPEIDEYVHAENRRVFGYVNRPPTRK